MNSIEKGSHTAREGFKNEDDIVRKFNNWRNDKNAQEWLKTMEYDLNEIEYVEAIKLSGYKTDIQVKLIIKLKKAIDIENLQVKLVSNKRGYNQVDKRWVGNYAEMWEMPENIISILKRYTGEEKPTTDKVRDKEKRRMFADEFTLTEQNILLDWLRRNQVRIISDILRGQGRFTAEWMLVAQKEKANVRWVLKPMNYCMNYFGNSEIEITARGSIRIGKITMQRKGGDGGRDTSKMLQFKINPAELFDDDLE